MAEGMIANWEINLPHLDAMADVKKGHASCYRQGSNCHAIVAGQDFVLIESRYFSGLFRLS